MNVWLSLALDALLRNGSAKCPQRQNDKAVYKHVCDRLPLMGLLFIGRCGNYADTDNLIVIALVVGVPMEAAWL